MITARDPEGVRRTDSRQRLGAGMNEDRASEHLDLLDDGVCQMRDQHGQIHDLLLVPCRYRPWRGARSLPPSGRRAAQSVPELISLMSSTDYSSTRGDGGFL